MKNFLARLAERGAFFLVSIMWRRFVADTIDSSQKRYFRKRELLP